MEPNAGNAIEVALSTLVSEVVDEPRLAAELQRARREFFGEGEAPVDGVAMRRFYEWFLLERDSETLGDVPVLLPQYAAAGEVLEESLAGVFHVTGVDAEIATATDLQSGDALELRVPGGALLAGDLVVGRLFEVGVEQWLPSTAAVVFRPGTPLAGSFQRDLARLELGRRLQQAELERLLLRRPDARPIARAAGAVAPLEHLEADLDRLLGDAGGRYSATAISAELARAPRLGAALGPLLDDLAFATSVDLDAAREVLVQMWNAHHPADADAAAAPAAAVEAPTPPGSTLGERLVRTLDEGLGRHADVEGLFAELERMAGLEPGAADDEENPFDRDEQGDPSGAGGDLEALVEEYVWETSAAPPAAATLRAWVGLQQNAPTPRTDLEAVLGQDLMRVLLHVYLAAPPAERAAAVRAAFAALGAFYAWAEESQQLELGSALSDCRGALLDQLDRLAAASVALSTTAAPSRRPGLLEVDALGADGCGLKDDHGRAHWLQLPPATLGLLRVGDLVLGALGGTADRPALAGLAVVLPADARALME